MREWGLSTEITELVVPTSARSRPVLGLHLQELNWWLNKTNLKFLHKFLSPHLTTIAITTDAFSLPGETVDPWERLPNKAVPKIRSAIKAFPSSLQFFLIRLGDGLETRFTEEISAFVLRCGESLEEFNTNLVLSTQAIVHLMKLPNLRTWIVEQGPPQVTDLIHHGVPEEAISIFSSLEVLSLIDEAALEWLTLFGATNNNVPWIMPFMTGGSLPTLEYNRPPPINSSLLSRLLPFTNLVDIFFGMECFMQPCVSEFTDQDVESLAIALPKLEALTLGTWPCNSNTCPTTFRSLLFLSIHCTKLKHLTIHFRTSDIRADMLDLLRYAYSQGAFSRPRCPLEALVTGEMLSGLADHDSTLISIGMLMIFPSLVKFITRASLGVRVEVMVRPPGPVGEAITTLTESLMRVYSQVRERAMNGDPIPPVVSLSVYPVDVGRFVR